MVAMLWLALSVDHWVNWLIDISSSTRGWLLISLHLFISYRRTKLNKLINELLGTKDMPSFHTKTKGNEQNQWLRPSSMYINLKKLLFFKKIMKTTFKLFLIIRIGISSHLENILAFFAPWNEFSYPLKWIAFETYLFFQLCCFSVVVFLLKSKL